MPRLPAHRVLLAARLDSENDPAEFFDTADVTQDDPELYLAQDEIREQRYEAVSQAICAGMQLRCHSNQADRGLREVCMTKYTDPETSEERYAVEVWHGLDEGKHDFANREAARQRLLYYLAKLEPLGRLSMVPVRGRHPRG
jgi:hypothetical protein